MSADSKHITYGSLADTDGVTRFIEHLFAVNKEAEQAGRAKTPVCIWGEHGIGKTAIVREYAKANDHRFVYVAPAQFEEMGDLVGMPKASGDRTEFLPPEWVPREEGPGILLLDDFNRADDRILRGIMQLLQNYELVSWRLPKGWQIVLTANPDGGEYSVTSLDDAMVTRMMHITLHFDVKAWSRWAERNQVDSRGINFVLTYPEIIKGARTTPRTLVQFFEAIAPITDLDKEIPLVQTLADSCLDEEVGSAFIAFVRNRLSELVSPEQILNAKNFEKQVNAPLKRLVVRKTVRVDVLATLCTRLSNYCNQKAKLGSAQQKNLARFLKIDYLPNDLRLTLAQELSGLASAQSAVSDADVAKMMLAKM